MALLVVVTGPGPQRGDLAIDDKAGRQIGDEDKVTRLHTAVSRHAQHPLPCRDCCCRRCAESPVRAAVELVDLRQHLLHISRVDVSPDVAAVDVTTPSPG